MRELIQRMRNGEIRIPRFQRPLRWRTEDVRALLDSVWRGYPIGSLLFWRRPAEAGTIRIGGSELAVPGHDDVWHVVDGQQRVTALAGALLDLDHRSDRRWTHSFDPENMAFFAGPPAPERHGVDVPVHVLGDLSRLGRWLRTATIDDATVATLESVQQALLDYTIPVYIVETDDEFALRGVFARLNSTGARMRPDEVFQALLGSESQDREALDLTRLQESCDIDGFGVPSRGDVLKAVLAMSGLDPTRRADRLAQRDLLQLVSMTDAEEALTATVDFLREDAGIPHWKLIPYPVVFAILARFFHVHRVRANDDPTGRIVRQELARWLWRGATQGAHERAAVSRMRQQLRVISDDRGALDAVDALLDSVPDEPVVSWKLEPFNLKNARSRIEVLALLTLGPRDHTGVISPRVLTSDDRFAREVFTPASLGEDDRTIQSLGRTAANRVVLDTAWTGLHVWLRDIGRLPDAPPILQSHLLSDTMIEALERGDKGRFLRERAARTRELVAEFLGKCCAWGEPRVRPIDHYLDPEGETDP